MSFTQNNDIAKKRILLVSDTSSRLFNGVQITISNLNKELIALGQHVYKIDMDNFDYLTFKLCPDAPCLYMKTPFFNKLIQEFVPDHIHIFTEGILGLSAKNACQALTIPYTTSYHTHFDMYLKKRYHMPNFLTLKYIKYFHQHSSKIIVPTESVKNKIKSLLPKNEIAIVSRGVDKNIFYCKNIYKKINTHYPTCVYFGRIAKEKNIEGFLKANINVKKIIIGDGPYLNQLKKQYPQALYVGYQPQDQIREILNEADIAVFPSKTDTFGISIIESLASGLPVAAYPVDGPRDILIHGITGYLHDDLTIAIQECLNLIRKDCVDYAKKFDWPACAKAFLNALCQI